MQAARFFFEQIERHGRPLGETAPQRGKPLLTVEAQIAHLKSKVAVTSIFGYSASAQ